MNENSAVADGLSIAESGMHVPSKAWEGRYVTGFIALGEQGQERTDIFVHPLQKVSRQKCW